VSYAGHIEARGSGAVNVTGTGGSGQGNGNYGVYVTNSNSKITSSGGNVTITGAGGGAGGDYQYYNHGVHVQDAGLLAAGANGVVEVNGTGGAGIYSYGVYVRTAGQIRASGSGAVTVMGAGGAVSSSYEVGVYVADAGTIISEGSASVTVKGTGGAAPGSGQHGVYVSNAGQITANGSGAITVDGTGGAGPSGSSSGVFVSQANARIASNGGDVTVTGIGGISSTFGGSHVGVSVQSSGSISAAGNGNLTVTGAGGTSTGGFHPGVIIAGTNARFASESGNIQVIGVGGGNNNHGVTISSAGFVTSSAGGAIAVTGTGTGSYGLHISTSNSRITTNNTPITITADSVYINGSPQGTIDSGSSTTTIQTRTAGTRIDLGGNDVFSGSPLTLGLTTTELNQISAGTLVIGRNDSLASGNITISNNISRAIAAQMQLISGSDIIFSGGQVNTGGGALFLDAGESPAAVRPLEAGTDVNASMLSFGSDLAIDINGPTVDTQYDQLNVIGEVDLSGVELVLGGTYQPLGGESFTIVNNDGNDPVLGTFNGLSEGALVTINGGAVQKRITYVGGDGNDVVLKNINKAVAFDVQQGETQRSFVRHVDVLFESADDLDDVVNLNLGRMQLERFALSGAGPATLVDLAGVVSNAGNEVRLDFGAQGIGGNRNKSSGDGYYQLSFDLDGDGTFETVKHFYRLLGDVNGDRQVSSLDASLILAEFGTSSAERDANGDGIVNALDRTLAIRSLEAALAPDLDVDD
jgi:hypothetical protein